MKSQLTSTEDKCRTTDEWWCLKPTFPNVGQAFGPNLVEETTQTARRAIDSKRSPKMVRTWQPLLNQQAIKRQQRGETKASDRRTSWGDNSKRFQPTHQIKWHTQQNIAQISVSTHSLHSLRLLAWLFATAEHAIASIERAADVTIAQKKEKERNLKNSAIQSWRLRPTDASHVHSQQQGAHQH